MAQKLDFGDFNAARNRSAIQMNKKNIEDVFELSPMQQGMLFHTLYAGKIDPYVYQYCARLEGDFHADFFNCAWQAVVDRHQSLRTAFYWQEADKALQVAYKHVELRVDLVEDGQCGGTQG